MAAIDAVLRDSLGRGSSAKALGNCVEVFRAIRWASPPEERIARYFGHKFAK